VFGRGRRGRRRDGVFGAGAVGRRDGSGGRVGEGRRRGRAQRGGTDVGGALLGDGQRGQRAGGRGNGRARRTRQGGARHVGGWWRQRRRGGRGAVGQGSVGLFFFFALGLDECRHVQRARVTVAGASVGKEQEWAAGGARRCDGEGWRVRRCEASGCRMIAASGICNMQGAGGRRSGRGRSEGEMRAGVLMQQQRLGDTDTDTDTRRARSGTGEQQGLGAGGKGASCGPITGEQRTGRGEARRRGYWSGSAGMGAGLLVSLVFLAVGQREGKVQGFLGPDSGWQTAHGRRQTVGGRWDG
jgi:hypothetical protein